jgi:hypothetical protein
MTQTKRRIRFPISRYNCSFSHHPFNYLKLDSTYICWSITQDYAKAMQYAVICYSTYSDAESVR